MPDYRSVDVLLRDGRAECYRWALEVGPQNTPFLILVIAALHELVGAVTDWILKMSGQPRLPDSAPVLSELWNELIEFRRADKTAFDEMKRYYSLVCDRVVSPDVVTRQDLEESRRVIERGCFRPQPVQTLIRAYCEALSAPDTDQQMREMLDRCPLVKSIKERCAQTQSEGVSEFDNAGMRELDWDRSPSLQKLWYRIRDANMTKAPNCDEYTWSRGPDATNAIDLGHAFVAALFLGPMLECIGAVRDQFEKGTFLSITERIDQVFALPAVLIHSLPAPSHSLTVAHPLPTQAVEGELPRAGPAARPPVREAPAGPLVILGDCDEEPIVRGVRKSRLSVPRFDVVKALLAAGKRGLSKDALATESKHSDAHRILKRLANSDPDWCSVILMAGEPGGRYRMRFTDRPTSPDISRKAPTKRNKG
jgi:hypothetical protein